MKIADEVSGYYLAGHLQRSYHGMSIAIAEEEWWVFREMSTNRFIRILQQLAAKVDLAKFRKHKRGPKKPKRKLIQNPKQPHVSTDKLLKA